MPVSKTDCDNLPNVNGSGICLFGNFLWFLFMSFSFPVLACFFSLLSSISTMWSFQYFLLHLEFLLVAHLLYLLVSHLSLEFWFSVKFSSVSAHFLVLLLLWPPPCQISELYCVLQYICFDKTIPPKHCVTITGLWVLTPNYFGL